MREEKKRFNLSLDLSCVNQIITVINKKSCRVDFDKAKSTLSADKSRLHYQFSVVNRLKTYCEKCRVNFIDDIKLRSSTMPCARSGNVSRTGHISKIIMCDISMIKRILESPKSNENWKEKKFNFAEMMSKE